MMYSCAIFSKDTPSLYDAQQLKIDTIIKKADIKKDDHILEIGTGWGTMAVELVQQTGCKVTTTTISEEQYQFAKAVIEKYGLEDRITLIKEDYRRLKGSFDRIISIEMLEAVGHKYLPTYFKQISHLLADQGKAVIQSITIQDEFYHAYKKNTDWIKKYIFPGGHLPSVGHIKSLIKELPLELNDLENIGSHYVTTLDKWKQAFIKKIPEVKTLGFTDIFIRKWIYYFEYCMAGFAEKHIENYQLVFIKK